MKIKCSKCGAVNDVELVRIYKHGNRKRPNWVGISRTYSDHLGRRSRNNICHECGRKKERLETGFTSREESKFPKVIKAVEAERAAAKFFENLGFSVIRTGALGPDLRCRIGELEWFVEVKRARDVHPRRFPGCTWVTDKVHRRRLSDDIIAFVLPNGRVYIDSMKIHLSRCQRGGQRTITGIVKEFGLSPRAQRG